MYNTTSWTGADFRWSAPFGPAVDVIRIRSGAVPGLLGVVAQGGDRGGAAGGGERGAGGQVGFVGEVQEVESAVDFAGQPAGPARGERAAVLGAPPFAGEDVGDDGGAVGSGGWSVSSSMRVISAAPASAGSVGIRVPVTASQRVGVSAFSSCCPRVVSSSRRPRRRVAPSWVRIPRSRCASGSWFSGGACLPRISQSNRWQASVSRARPRVLLTVRGAPSPAKAVRNQRICGEVVLGVGRHRGWVGRAAVPRPG